MAYVSTPDEAMAHLPFVIRLFLGLIFLSSALGKLVNRAQFQQAVLNFAILPSVVARIYSMFLPWTELVLSLALITGFALRPVALILSFVIISFTTAIAVNLKRGRSLKCHCYGILGNSTISWGIVARNALLLMLAVVLLIFALGNLRLNDWLYNWQHDLLAFTSVESFVPLVLLIAFGIAMLWLVAAAVDLEYHISQLDISGSSETKGPRA